MLMQATTGGNNSRFTVGEEPDQIHWGARHLARALQGVPAHLREAASRCLPTILMECLQSSVTLKPQVAYILATAEHESGLGLQMTEPDGSAYEQCHELGNWDKGDGHTYRGRGFVRIRGRSAYLRWSNQLGIDLIAEPHLAADPFTAAKILVRGMRDGNFTGIGLAAFIGESAQYFVNARRIVDDQLNAAQNLADLAERYFATL